MPRETIAFVLVFGQAAALTWGLVSLEIWTLNERAPAALLASALLLAIARSKGA